MTDENRATAGPPWSVDLLADLHAGVIDEAQAAELWPRVEADPRARAIIDALEATKADLAELGWAPAPPMPAHVAARLDAAIAEEAQRAFPQVAPVVSIDAARRRRNKRVGWITGVVAVAAAAIAAVAIAIPKTSTTEGNPIAAAPPSTGQAGSGAPLAVRSDQPQAALGQLTSGLKDYGVLGTAQALDACLKAAGFPGGLTPVSVRPGSIDGKPAILVLLTTGKIAEFRLVALAPSCGAQPLLDRVIGK